MDICGAFIIWLEIKMHFFRLQDGAIMFTRAQHIYTLLVSTTIFIVKMCREVVLADQYYSNRGMVQVGECVNLRLPNKHTVKHI